MRGEGGAGGRRCGAEGGKGEEQGSDGLCNWYAASTRRAISARRAHRKTDEPIPGTCDNYRALSGLPN